MIQLPNENQPVSPRTQPQAVAAPSLFRVRFTLRAIEDLDLADEPGPTLRGAFGRSLFSQVCPHSEPRCSGCELLPDCAYGRVFETPDGATQRLATDRRFSNPPHPAWLRWVDNVAGYHGAGRLLAFEIVGLPRVRRHLTEMATAVARMAERGLGPTRGRCEVLRCDDVVTGRAVHSGVELLTVGLWVPPDPFAFHGIQRVEMDLLSPLRIHRDGRLVSRPTFRDIAVACARRWSLLSAMQGEESPDAMPTPSDAPISWSEADLVHLERFDASRTRTERRSGRTHAQQSFDGLLGRIAFRGHVAQCVPLLALGELAGIGKGTSLGFGRFRISSLS